MIGARFSVGVNYLPPPAVSGRLSDMGQVREDFAHIASLGLDAVRLLVPWNDLQPQPDVVDRGALDSLEQMVVLAGEAGLRSLPSLCGIRYATSLMPEWTRGMTLYRGQLLEAQLAIAGAVGERLRDHAATVVGWDIGHQFTSVDAPRAGKISTGDHGTVPVAEHEVAEWARRLARAMRESSIPVTAGAFSNDLVTDTNVRFGSLCASFSFASMQGSTTTLPFARNRLDAEAIAFLAMVTAAFSSKPVLVTGVGNPTCPPGKFSPYERVASSHDAPRWEVSPDDPTFATYPCLTEDENASFATAVLERLHADGRLGAYWWWWRDDDGRLDGAPGEGSFGIIRRDGSERPVAAALSAFAREARSVVKASDMQMISSTYYYRTLPDSTRTLYSAFLGFVEERRAALGR